MNFITRFKVLPVSTKRLLSFGVILALLVGLPLFIWAVITQRFLFGPRAATGEATCTHNPTSLTANLVSTNPDGTINYEVAIRNNDTGPCPSENYILSATLPPGWSGYFTNPSFALIPGGSYGDNHLYITPPQGYNNSFETFTIVLNSDVQGNNTSVVVFYPQGATPIPTPTPTPNPTCQPRPACLDTNPRCLPPVPAGGWCPFIHVTAPNGGETVMPGQHLTINWESSGINGYLIYLENSLGQSSLIGATQAPSSSYDWVVNSPLIGTSQYKIKVIDSYQGGVAGTQDESDGYFTISTNPQPTVRPISILFKLGGVNDDSASYAKRATNAAEVSVKFIASELNYKLGYSTPPVMADYVGNGIYALHFGIWSSELPAGTDYSIILKGEKHVAVKFCSNGQTAHCSGQGNISIPSDPSQNINLDFTGIPLPPGDLYPQDGSVTTLGANSDLARLIVLLSKDPATLTPQDLLVGDLDYNGIINIKDLFLLRQTLQTRYDEN